MKKMDINGFWQKSDQQKFIQLGCVVNILARHPQFASRTISGLRHWTENAIAHDQIEIFFHGGLPSGYVAWAYLSEDVIGRILFSDYMPHWSEWNEGEYVWIMDACLLTDSDSSEFIDFCSRKFAAERYVFWSEEGVEANAVRRLDVSNQHTSSISKASFMRKIAFI